MYTVNKLCTFPLMVKHNVMQCKIQNTGFTENSFTLRQYQYIVPYFFSLFFESIHFLFDMSRFISCILNVTKSLCLYALILQKKIASCPCCMWKVCGQYANLHPPAPINTYLICSDAMGASLFCAHSCT